MKHINHKELSSIIKTAYNKKIPLFVWGTFGIGKSSVVRQVADELGINLIDVRISQLEPSDLRGLPKIDDGVTRWLPPSWLPSDEHSKGILFFDEINLAPPSIQASAYQLILDRQLGEYKLPANWVIVSAGNRLEDKANVFELPIPLANRFIHAELNIPRIEDFTDWGLANGIDGRILSFLNFKPSRLFSYDSKIKEKAIATPRMWEYTSNLIKDNEDLDEIELLSSCAVGEGVAIEFMAFLKLKRKIDIAELLNNPKKIADIKELDMKYTIIGGISEYYRKHKNKELLSKVLNVCNYMEEEFSMFLLRFVRAVDNTFFTREIIKLPEWKKHSINFAKFVL